MADFVVTQAQLLQGTGPVVLGHHVGIFQHPPKDFPPFVGFQVQQDAALAPVDVVVAGDGGAAAGVVNLDNVGAVLGQGAPHSRPGQDDAQVQHLDAFQGGTQRLFHAVPSVTVG